VPALEHAAIKRSWELNAKANDTCKPKCKLQITSCSNGKMPVARPQQQPSPCIRRAGPFLVRGDCKKLCKTDANRTLELAGPEES